MKSRFAKLMASLVALVVCFATLIGTTYAWFTDSAISSNNKIVAGSLKVDLELLDKQNGWVSLKNDNAPIFDYDKWEPGYTDVKILKVENEGTLALKWNAKFVSEKALSALADVIDVYVLPSQDELTYPANKNLDGYTNVGTVKEFVNTIEETTYGTLLANEVAYLGIALKMQETAGNEYQGLNLGGAFDIQIVATQLSSEEDSFGSDYDNQTTYFTMSLPVAIEESNQEDATLSTGKVEVELTADLLNALPEEVTQAKLFVSDPKVENESVTFESIELIDQNNQVIDLSQNSNPITITLSVPQLAGKTIEIFHDGELVATELVDENGVVTYSANHFCEVMASLKKVATADELIGAIENGDKYIMFANDIKIDPASMSNAYGKTGINIKNGQTIDGNGFILDIKGAGGTWDSGINTTGGVIKNITITGSFRGIFINHNSSYSEQVVLENVILDGTTYTISCDQGMNQTLKAINCTFKGWTSYAATIGSVEFIGCTFGEGNGYAFCRPYAPTTFENCVFEEGFQVNAREEVKFNNCTFSDKSCVSLGSGARLFFNGVEESYYHEFIGSAESLFEFAKSVNEGGDSWTNQKVCLVADIDLENKAWTPIGQTGATEFRGIFDGQNHTIKNLNVDNSDKTDEHTSSGLFGWAERNVTIQNVNIDGATVKGNHNVAVIVGYTYQGKIINCNVINAEIICTHANDDACGDKCGLIVGYAGNESRITNCSASNSTVKAGRDAGQLVGTGYNVSVSGCSATNVTVTANGDCTGNNIKEAIIGRVMG